MSSLNMLAKQPTVPITDDSKCTTTIHFTIVLEFGGSVDIALQLPSPPIQPDSPSGKSEKT